MKDTFFDDFEKAFPNEEKASGTNENTNNSNSVDSSLLKSLVDEIKTLKASVAELTKPIDNADNEDIDNEGGGEDG